MSPLAYRLYLQNFNSLSLQKVSAGAVILSAICWPLFSAHAQLAPQVTPRDLRPETASPASASVPQAAPAQAPANSAKLFVQLSDVVVQNGGANMAAATEALIAPLRGRRIAVADFYALADAIESLYQTQGYALVRVALPPQSIHDGDVLRLTVVDGFIERIDTSALDERARRQVERLLRGLVGKHQLQSADLERALTLAGRTPGVALRSTLRPGSATGAVVLVLDGSFKVLGGSVAVDNRLSPSLGRNETTVQASLQQVLGFGEQLYAYASSDADRHTAYRDLARRRVVGAGVQFPIGSDGLIFNPELTTSDSKPDAQPYTPYTRSRFDRMILRVVYPLILNRQHELTMTGSFDASNQKDTLPDFGYTLDEERNRVFRIAASWRQAWVADSALSITAALSKGVTRFGARGGEEVERSGVPLSRADINPAFTKLETGVVIDTSPNAWLQGHTSLRTQHIIGSGAVPVSELFSVDGDDALSSLASGAISADAGWTIRQELTHAFLFDVEGPAQVRPYVFGAIGDAHQRVAQGVAAGSTKDIGVGIRAQWRFASLSLEYGHIVHSSHTPNSDRLLAKAQVQF